MKKRINHGDVPPERWAAIEETARKKISELMGFPEARVVKVSLFDPGMEGRTGMDVKFEPELSEEEAKQFHAAMVLLSRMYGGRDPIRAAKA